MFLACECAFPLFDSVNVLYVRMLSYTIYQSKANLSEVSGLLPYAEAVQWLDSDALSDMVISQAKEANKEGLSVPHLSIRSSNPSTVNEEEWIELAGVPQEAELTDLLKLLLEPSSTSTTSSFINASSIHTTEQQCTSVSSDKSTSSATTTYDRSKQLDLFESTEADIRAASRYEWRSENLLRAMLEAMPEGWPTEMPFDESHFSRFDPTRYLSLSLSEVLRYVYISTMNL